MYHFSQLRTFAETFLMIRFEGLTPINVTHSLIDSKGLFMTANLEKTKKLAQKGTLLTGILTFFMPLIGYMYTGRYKALFKTFGIFFGILVLCFMAEPSLDEDEDFMTGMMFLYGAGTALENTRAVIHGKKRLKNQQIPALNPDKVKIQLLKVAKAQGAITVADCVLETGCSAAEVRQYLEELQQEDLIRVDNRESDGAIIYRII
jgi:hypothetical protein